MFIAALFTIAKTWNQPKCPLMIDCTRKIWHIYIMEYYAAIQIDEFVFFLGTWMNLVTIILNKLTQEEKIQHNVLSLTAEISRCCVNELQWGSLLHNFSETALMVNLMLHN
uniref:DUF1725 domain-containing protein n=1 Tax=Callithrix jacchus TaxID=9483 RepID=A0A8I3WDT6_CALJA